MAFSRHEQLLSNIDLLKVLEVTALAGKPLVTLPGRRVEFSLLTACFCIAARDGGLCFISVAGVRRSSVSLESKDAVEMVVADDSLDKEPSDAVSLHGVLIVLFLEYTVLAVSILSGAQVLTALRASVATATVTIRKIGMDRGRDGRALAFALSCFAASDLRDSVTRFGRQ